ncbi:MAG: HipA domain-containing protein, partial [Bacteroidota bacterium]
MVSDARVMLWGRLIGAVSWLDDKEVGVFEYAPEFRDSGIELAPVAMPLREFPYEFPSLNRQTFKGLPGLLADSLPDRFGNAIIDSWLASEARSAASFNSVERLCYTGSRGMGALEYEPSIFGPPTAARTQDVEKLVALANRVLDERAGLTGIFDGKDDRSAVEDILRVGTSAGGARAKAILAWNPTTGEFRSGQISADDGFEYWIMKFDGISNNRDKELADPQGYGQIEFAYHLMAVDAGISMMPCRLHPEGGRSHFMTRRFDRTARGDKHHMQSLGAMAHFDYNDSSLYSYEQAIQIIRRLDLPADDLQQQVLRAMFNVLAWNRDDHVKNIAFLMNRSGQWRLSPAYDVTYAYDPAGQWTSRHQMSINGKRDDIVRADLMTLAETAGIKKGPAGEMYDLVAASIRRWRDFAETAGVAEQRIEAIWKILRSTSGTSTPHRGVLSDTNPVLVIAAERDAADRDAADRDGNAAGSGVLSNYPRWDPAFSETEWDQSLNSRLDDLEFDVILEKPRTAEENLAIDEALLYAAVEGKRKPVFWMWDWSERAVVLGSYQSVGAEFNPDVAKREGFSFARRVSGGGAMVVEPERTITFSLIVPESVVEGLSFRQSFAFLDMWVIRALRGMGIPASYRPINDIVSPVAKIGGAAQCRRRRTVLHHVTMA